VLEGRKRERGKRVKEKREEKKGEVSKETKLICACLCVAV